MPSGKADMQKLISGKSSGSAFLFILLAILLSGLAACRHENTSSTPKAIPAPVDVAAPPQDAEKTASGLASKVLLAGKGAQHPTAASEVTVHYTGWTPDGKMLESSLGGEPVTFPLTQVIKGWTEGVQLMVVGETRRFWIPGSLAYDSSSRKDAPKGMLVFDIELLSIK